MWNNVPNITEVDGFLVRDTRLGPTLILDPLRPEQAASYMQIRGILRLEVNNAIFKYADTFLQSLPAKFAFITGFSIIHRTTVDIAWIVEFGSRLRDISVQTSCDTPIDFSVFPELRHCRVMWRKKRRSVWGCRFLEFLQLDYYKEHSIAAVSQLSRLRELRVNNSPLRSLSGIETLALRTLCLINVSRLESLAEVGALTDLEELDINGGKRIQNLDPIRNCTKLRELTFCNVGEIPSLGFLRDLKSLEAVWFYEDTNVLDGDMTPLLSPGIKKVAFMKRKHYSHTREQVEREIAAMRVAQP